MCVVVYNVCRTMPTRAKSSSASRRSSAAAAPAPARGKAAAAPRATGKGGAVKPKGRASRVARGVEEEVPQSARRSRRPTAAATISVEAAEDAIPAVSHAYSASPFMAASFSPS